MKKQMKRTVYEAPVTERFSVELEGSFCASVNLGDENADNGVIKDQEVNGDFNGNFSGEEGSFGNGDWD